MAQPGGAAQVCVSLVTGGEEVAGTQNDLVWDGTCMTLNDNGCSAAGTHGKQVNTRIQNSADFRMRVLVLSLSDVDPIDDGVLYCCQVQGEAPSGSCCSISVVNTGASDSKGNAVAGVGGNTGTRLHPGRRQWRRWCRRCRDRRPDGQQHRQQPRRRRPGHAGRQHRRRQRRVGQHRRRQRRVGASAPPANQVLQGGGGGAPVAPAPGSSGVQVLPGGGGGQVAQAPEAQAPATPIALPTRAAGALVQPAAPAAPAAALPPATAVAAAPTAPPTPADTPTTAVPTAVPPTKAPPSTPTAPRSTPTAASGWFGCQIGGGASAAPMLGLGLLFAALAGVRRRRPPHR